MPNNKSPEPDLFLTKFYKQFWHFLSPVFFKLSKNYKELHHMYELSVHNVPVTVLYN